MSVEMKCSIGDVNKLRGMSLYRPNDRRLSAKLMPTFAHRRVPRDQRDGSNLGFLDRSHYFFFHAARKLYSRG
jgi:hypothetical protein